jgi:hypothetical protein
MDLDNPERFLGKTHRKVFAPDARPRSEQQRTMAFQYSGAVGLQ